MARPIDDSTAYRVKLHINGGYRYASTQPIVVDPNRERGRNKHHRIHWGTVDEDNKFHPNKTFINADLEERRKLVFPPEWDMSEVESLASERKAGRPAGSEEDKNLLFGDIWLMDRVAEATGLKDDLLKAFKGNADMVNQILTIAMYQCSNGGTLNRLAHWQRIEWTPYAHPLAAPDITYLTQKIGEPHRMALFRLRAARVSKDDLCAVDSTSRSAYGSSLADIKYGNNKERLPLEQTTEVVVYDLTTHMPIYYRTFPGNIPDSRSIETILLELKHAGFPNVILITDRGYESVRNLENYIIGGQRLIMWIKVKQNLVLKRIKEFGTFSHSPQGMEIDPQSRIYGKQYDVDYKVEVRKDVEKEADKLKLNLYFDPTNRAADLIDLDIQIKKQEEALAEILQQKLPLDDDATIRKNYSFYDLEFEPKGRILKSYQLSAKKVEVAKLTAGFFANMTLGTDLTPMQSLDAYALRDEQEKYYQQMKTPLGNDRQRNWSEDGKTGRLLILFVAMIISSYIKYKWKTTTLRKQFCSFSEVLDEMRPIRIIEHKGHAKFVTPFVGRQLDICKQFGFEIPAACDKKYVSRKIEPKRPGRPRKKPVVTEEG